MITRPQPVSPQTPGIPAMCDASISGKTSELSSSIFYFLFFIPFRSFKFQIPNLKFLIPLLSALTCLADSTAQPVTHPPENRFLLIVETSSPMQKRSDGVTSTVEQVVRSGFQGQARPGDTIGIWTYNEILTAGEFPLQTWSKDGAKHIASGMLAFLADQKLSKQPHFNCVLPTLQSVVEDSPFLTVVVICSGTDPVKGTPFDKEIAKQLADWHDQEQKAHMPLIVVLRAAHGSFTHYSVTPAPWQVEMPPLPSELVAAPARPAPKPVTAAPPVAPLIVVGKHKAPAPEPESANSASPASTNLAVRVPPPGDSQAPATAPSLTSPGSSTATNLSAAVQVPPAPQPTSDLVVHAREMTPMAAVPAVAPRPNSFSVILKRSLIAAGVLAALSLLVVFRRPRQNHVSLITHSINRDR
jgi:hypothetical protein